MTTKPRQRSESDFYHVFQRGVNLFDIFEDDADREFYLERMCRYALDANVEIHAWCFMSNHVHLLLRANLKDLSGFMRRLGSVYVRRFNLRHGRTGPLFECRFASVCVETDTQLLAVVRYIHRNPVYHDESALFGNYRWSSYGEYTSGEAATCDSAFVLSQFGSIEELVRFHEKELPSDLERHMDIGVTAILQDDEARERGNMALREFGFDVSVGRIGTLKREMRDEALALVKKTTGCSMRQLRRLTAVAVAAIRGALLGTGKITIRDDCELTALSQTERDRSSGAAKGIGFLPVGRLLPPRSNGSCALPDNPSPTQAVVA